MFVLEEIKKIQSRERDHLERILHHQRKLKSEFEFRKMELKSQWKELKRRKEESESERKRLAVETVNARSFVLHELLHVITTSDVVFHKYFTFFFFFLCVCVCVFLSFRAIESLLSPVSC